MSFDKDTRSHIDAARELARNAFTGQFGEQSKMEPGTVELVTVTDRFGFLNSWSPNTDFGVPQANDLDKIVVATQAISEGANTNESVGEVLDIEQRTGAYYTAAAGYLGFISKRETDYGLHVYEPTVFGEEFLALNDEERCVLLSEMVDRLDQVQTIRNHGEDTLQEQLTVSEDFSDTTIDRRVRCANSWSNQAMDVYLLRASCEDSFNKMGDRFGPAIRNAREHAEKLKASSQPKKTFGDVCSGCFMTMPLSGVCDSCD